MPVTQEETKKYFEFVQEQVKLLNGMDIDGTQTVWHYTTGDALINIVQSGSLYSTQVSCLNDSTEVHYGETLLREAFLEIQKQSHPEEETELLKQLIDDSAPEGQKAHPPSDFFVTCFSSDKDDLSQWRAYGGGENGYALAFGVGGFFNRGTTIVVRVNYKKELHISLAARAAKATLEFFREGLEARKGQDTSEWPKEFRAEWFRVLGKLAPMVKDPAFKGENEYRIVHTFIQSELKHLRFRQKQSLMSMHLPLVFPPATDVRSTGLPILEVMVGPSRHKETSRLSALVLLQQAGYFNVPVTMSDIPFQTT
jgi:Protein of unknown function (DUF2971)